ncbi:MAG: glyceraldehyde 3-phosphate dehydrogenase [Sphingobacteriales bacterium]|jgi:glyceraldehyde 3-phosphate dehydrogenase
MSITKVAINGFGRIGRSALKALLPLEGVEVAVINDLSDPNTLAHLFKYDSVHGVFDGEISVSNKQIIINNKAIEVTSTQKLEDLQWSKLKIDIVIESSGRFTSKEDAQKHLKAGAKKVIISAPSKDNIPMVCMGINDHILTSKDTIISNASCTTNNVASIIQILDENWKIESGYITTIHSFTGDQSLHDRPHKDLRRARAATQSIIPTSTGAAKAITKIFPHLEGKLGGAGIRVPVINGSLTDFTCFLEKGCSVEEINARFKEASLGKFKNILQYTEDPIVSVDVIGNKYSCVFDSQLTSIVGKIVKVVGWYDNESGYANRLADLVVKLKNLN